MKIAKRKKAQHKKAQASKARPMSRFAQELLQSVQQAILIQRGAARAGERWRLTKLADGNILRERLNVPPKPPEEA
jgi:hypothetical protein